ncbi:hypothetical protein MKW98_011487 [Papaver atlanticum]|uniref:Bystin n=1 Tax=Papaver atlanticum TaxID=357466 RepID=A0AAD4XJ18_9MAGN|nr:hypothetical protein MKW98_011487 [Papaver atlanticum]
MEVAKKKNRLLRKQKPFLKPSSCISKKRFRSDMSSKILREALIQQKEIEDEARKEDPFSSIPEIGVSDDDSDFDDEYVDSLDAGFVPETDEIQDYNDYEVEMEMLEQFESSMLLSERIVNKIEKAEKVSAEQKPQMDNRLVDIYKGIGEYLSRYTSGKLPKAFLSLPSKPYWEDALYLTEPKKWSAYAMWQATNIFASNMSPKRAQRFYSSVLLRRVREDIRKNKRLHFDLYRALKKSVYKPQAFNKGILFPLCKNLDYISGTCTLREAVIIGSIIQKVSIPADHSSAALMQLAEIEYCGTTSYFIKLLLDKKYALPYRALDAVVAHFMRFVEDSRVMPVIWHQSLLTLVQRNKYELTKEDKENIERLIQHQKHHMVTEDIRRELQNSRNRGEKKDPTFIPSSYHQKPIEEDRFNYPIVPMEEE